MSTLNLENVPPDVYERLQRRASASNRSVAEEAVRILEQLLPDPPFLTEEIPAPCDLPLPGPGEPVAFRDGPLPLPDPILPAGEGA